MSFLIEGVRSVIASSCVRQPCTCVVAQSTLQVALISLLHTSAHFMSPGLLKFLPHTVYYTGSMYLDHPSPHHLPSCTCASSTHHQSTTILIPCFFPHWLPLLLKTLVWRALSLSLRTHVHFSPTCVVHIILVSHVKLWCTSHQQ